MQTKKYSRGVFLYLLHHKTKESLIEQINFIKSLPDLNHVEVWIEENLKLSEILLSPKNFRLNIDFKYESY